MKKTIKGFLASFIAAILAASPAFAEEQSGNESGIYVALESDKTGFYLQPEVGYVKLDIDPCGSCELDGFSVGLTGGWRFNDFIAAEGGFRHARGFDNGEDDITATNWLIGIRGFYDFGQFALAGKGGFHLWELEVDGDSVDGADTNRGWSDHDFYLGAGGTYKIADNLALGLEYTRFFASGAGIGDMDYFSGSLVWNF